MRMALRWACTVIALLACVAACGDEGAVAPAVGSDLVPCKVAAILEQHCVGCHGADLHHGATITLVHASDFRKPRGGERVGGRVLDRVMSAARPMPPTPAQ